LIGSEVHRIPPEARDRARIPAGCKQAEGKTQRFPVIRAPEAWRLHSSSSCAGGPRACREPVTHDLAPLLGARAPGLRGSLGEGLDTRRELRDRKQAPMDPAGSYPARRPRARPHSPQPPLPLVPPPLARLHRRRRRARRARRARCGRVNGARRFVLFHKNELAWPESVTFLCAGSLTPLCDVRLLSVNVCYLENAPRTSKRPYRILAARRALHGATRLKQAKTAPVETALRHPCTARPE
jgi:hypothetical protein